jgi:hypothetical protein
MGLRITKIDQEPIADVFGNVAIVSSRDFGTDLLIGAQDLAQVFRVEPFGERGGPSQIAEHHC